MWNVPFGFTRRWSGAVRRGTIADDYGLHRQDFHLQLSEETQVPMFWAGREHAGIHQPAMLGASIIGVAFGATHFIAWNFEFQSHIELLLWRVSCIAIIAGPLNLTIFYGSVQK